MIELLPMPGPFPENEILLVQMYDDQLAFGFCYADAYETKWIIQLPFQESIPVTSPMIKRWSKLPKPVKNESYSYLYDYKG